VYFPAFEGCRGVQVDPDGGAYLQGIQETVCDEGQEGEGIGTDAVEKAQGL
jgi:hypothetical protein